MTEWLWWGYPVVGLIFGVLLVYSTRGMAQRSDDPRGFQQRRWLLAVLQLGLWPGVALLLLMGPQAANALLDRMTGERG